MFWRKPDSVEPNKWPSAQFYFSKTYIITFPKAWPWCDLFKSASLMMVWIRTTLLYTPAISSHVFPWNFSFTVISRLHCVPVRLGVCARKTKGGLGRRTQSNFRLQVQGTILGNKQGFIILTEEEETDCYCKSLRTPLLRFSFRENVNRTYTEGSNCICLTDRAIEEVLYIFA